MHRTILEISIPISSGLFLEIVTREIDNLPLKNLFGIFFIDKKQTQIHPQAGIRTRDLSYTQQNSCHYTAVKQL